MVGSDVADGASGGFFSGAKWAREYRYQGDAYGEHADGEPFNGTGIGRAWPLLTGDFLVCVE